MYSLYKNEYRIFKPVETVIRRGLRQIEADLDGLCPRYCSEKRMKS
jgi:hypothetical protein